MSQKDQPVIRFAVVGAGRIGKRHANLIAGHPEAELTSLVDPTPKELEPFNVPIFSSIEEMLASDQRPDVVNIASPNGLHAEHAIKALEAGCHVVIEKPMALKKADAEKVIYTALHKHRQVFVVMQNRYSPPSRWLKEMIDTKRLGEVFMVQVNCFWNRDERYYTGGWHGTLALDGGTLYTQFSHFIDIVYWLFGDLTNIRTKMRDFRHKDLTEFEDSGVISFELTDGGMGTLSFSTAVWDKNMESSITIIGEKGSIKVAGQYMNEVVYCHVEDYEMPELEPTSPPNDYGPFQGSAANHGHVIQNVIDVMHGTNTITTNALEGLKVVDIIERIYQADKTQ